MIHPKVIFTLLFFCFIVFHVFSYAYVYIRCNNERLHKLPQQWLYNILEEIKSSDPSSKLCATRRSAGIPFYIQVSLINKHLILILL